MGSEHTRTHQSRVPRQWKLVLGGVILHTQPSNQLGQNYNLGNGPLVLIRRAIQRRQCCHPDDAGIASRFAAASTRTTHFIAPLIAPEPSETNLGRGGRLFV